MLHEQFNTLAISGDFEVLPLTLIHVELHCYGNKKKANRVELIELLG